jgi:putative oxidoreductase
MTESVNPTREATGDAEGTTAWNARRRLAEAVLAAIRVVVSFLFLCHGLQGLFGAFGGIDGQGTAVVPGSWPDWWGSAIELVGGAFVLLGLFTRPLAVLCSGAMAYAYFTVHQPQGLLPVQNLGEPATLYCWIFLLIAVVGPGPFALDTVFQRRRAARKSKSH